MRKIEYNFLKEDPMLYQILFFRYYPKDCSSSMPLLRHYYDNSTTNYDNLRQNMQFLAHLFDSPFSSKTLTNPYFKPFLRALKKADDRNRTGDLLTTNEVRYRLCHISLGSSEPLDKFTIKVLVCQEKS